MNTTVTMSLERYQELEAKEKALHGFLGGNDLPLVVENMPYGTMVYAKSPHGINQMLIDECERQTQWGEKMRQKAVEANKK